VSLRAPTVQSGQRLTAALWNETARAVNEGLAAPKDLTAGRFADEQVGIGLHEIARETTSVRVFNPDDDTQYVDVDRITSLTVRNDQTGEVSTTYFSS